MERAADLNAGVEEAASAVAVLSRRQRERRRERDGRRRHPGRGAGGGNAGDVHRRAVPCFLFSSQFSFSSSIFPFSVFFHVFFLRGGARSSPSVLIPIQRSVFFGSSCTSDLHGSTPALPTPRLAYVPRDASSIPTGADFATHRKRNEGAHLQPSLRRSLPPAPPHAPSLPTGTLGDHGVVLGSRAMGRLRHPRRSARARRTPTLADAAADVGPSPAGRISGRPVRGSEPTPDLGAPDFGSRRWALGRKGEGEEEAAGRCTPVPATRPTPPWQILVARMRRRRPPTRQQLCFYGSTWHPVARLSIPTS
ncbi:uncharacterized protein LOC120679289 [Panicum virgatum]|uniref:Uncharacterized protein n=1 Tax=Panicum virgatum TaxID=38727 RepID=A0A8T0QUQ6_PANVG|nr:uncharacterized protein LOC120679289 [Panicum virgatum]XP_039816767.1 uncharacterized protein LOC120679289 [Panicum virgatum]XP_039816768.1 uncharacterized protein LOC120679289 [Panicum virgatum]XP_039816769.1 uncharacterized protein LOC120679289 [Panicum virgatum]XP_039816770.1 uncharacterized protein LOC120679289 [Panicum virgatum]XP_039816772.1 uncharacterized protein LOC120679289 [Panicum virgatum]KAG2576982.1 hypothetical protein PVAP13_6NG067530 [Panicum virgatum]